MTPPPSQRPPEGEAAQRRTRAWFFQSDATRIPLPDRSVALTVTSPPYLDARTYGIGAQRKCEAWIEWMLDVIAECQRVTVGPVIIVAAGVTRKRNYQPGCEGLMYRWWQRGGDCQLYRPVYWHRVGIPGSGGTDWFRADVEYCMCFKRPGELPFSDNTACGHPPKWAPGGAMSNRLSDGARVNQWGHSIASGATIVLPSGVVRSAGQRPSHKLITRRSRNGVRDHTKRGPDGSMTPQHYTVPTLANPGNLIHVKVGGGLMGHPLAHENDAPFPEKLVEFFIKSLCAPGQTVLDPFSGSGTTVATANRLGRDGIGCDLRMNQCLLGRRRVNDPVKPRKLKRAKVPIGEQTLFGTEAA